jgi:hypothetical protein
MTILFILQEANGETVLAMEGPVPDSTFELAVGDTIKMQLPSGMTIDCEIVKIGFTLDGRTAMARPDSFCVVLNALGPARQPLLQ